MAKEEEAHGKEGAAAAPAAADAAPKKDGAMVQILALVAVFGIGAFVAFMVFKFVTGHQTPEKEGAKHEEVAKHSPEHNALVEKAVPFELGDVIANIKGQGGRRYVKISVTLWVPKNRMSDIQHEGIKQLMTQALEERLAQYDMEELGNEQIGRVLRRAFVQEINRILRESFGTAGSDTVYVEQVVVTNKLIQ
jgi:flagellar basal body-associated protein FliL